MIGAAGAEVWGVMIYGRGWGFWGSGSDRFGGVSGSARSPMLILTCFNSVVRWPPANITTPSTPSNALITARPFPLYFPDSARG